MTETMVERVAAAMQARRMELIDRPLSRCYGELARAAIGAMREPTIGMMAAGYQSRFLSAGASNAEAIMLTSKHVADDRNVTHFKAAWAAACDAALSEPTTRERGTE